jgi:hypothetical protein
MAVVDTVDVVDVVDVIATATNPQGNTDVKACALHGLFYVHVLFPGGCTDFSDEKDFKSEQSVYSVD